MNNDEEISLTSKKFSSKIISSLQTNVKKYANNATDNEHINNNNQTDKDGNLTSTNLLNQTTKKNIITENKNSASQNKDILTGLNKIQALKILSKEDSRIKHHLSYLLGSINLDDDINENLYEKLEINQNLITMINGDRERPSIIKQKELKRKTTEKFVNKSRNFLNFSKQMFQKSSTLNESDTIVVDKITRQKRNASFSNNNLYSQSKTILTDSKSLEDLEKLSKVSKLSKFSNQKKSRISNSFLESEDSLERDKHLHLNTKINKTLKQNSKRSENKINVDQENQDFLENYENVKRKSLKNSKIEKINFYYKDYLPKVNYINEDEDININHYSRSSSLKSIWKSRKLVPNPMLIRSKTQKLEKMQNSNKKGKASRINSIKRLNKAKTEEDSSYDDEKTDKSEINTSREKLDENSNQYSPKSIKLKKGEKEDLEIIRESLRDNMNLNLKSPLKKISKNYFKSFESDSQNSSENKEIKYIKDKDRILMKRGLVYDSYSDEEEEFTFIPIFFIHPDSNFKFYFDFILFIATIYTIMYTPINLAFDDCKIDFYIFICEIIVDSIHFLDILLGFVLAYFDFDERLITNHKKMTSNYMSSWMAIDIISFLPFNSLFAYLKYYVYYKDDLNSYITLDTRFYHIFTIMRFFKLFKTFKANKYIEWIRKLYFDEVQVKSTHLRLLKFFSYFLMVTHLLACVFIYLGKLETPNWIVADNLQDSSFEDIYVSSLYFNLSTIFTNGYGDIVSKNIYEKSFNLLLLMVGILIYSFAVSSLSNLIQTTDDKTKRYYKRMEVLEQMRHKYSLAGPLYDKIMRFLNYDLNTNKVDKNEFIQELPVALKNEMILQMYRPIIDNFIFFKNFENVDFIIRVIMAMKPFSAVKNERLVQEGDFIEEILFVKRGALVLEIGIKVVNETKLEALKFDENLYPNNTFGKNNNFNYNFNNRMTFKNNNTFNFTRTQNNFLNQNTKNESGSESYSSNRDNLIDNELTNLEFMETQFLKIIELRRNEHYGDVLMFLNRRSPLSVRVKSKIAELFLMKKTDLVNISVSFPEIFEKITRKSAFNQKQIDLLIKRTKLLFYENHKDEFILHKTKITSRKNSTVKRRTMIFNNPLSEDDLKNKAYDINLNSIPSDNNSNKMTSNKDLIEPKSSSSRSLEVNTTLNLKSKSNLGNPSKNRTIISERDLEEEVSDVSEVSLVSEISGDSNQDPNYKDEIYQRNSLFKTPILNINEMKKFSFKQNVTNSDNKLFNKISDKNLLINYQPLLSTRSINNEIEENEVKKINDTKIKNIYPKVSNNLTSREIDHDKILLNNKMKSFISESNLSQCSNNSINYLESNALFNNIANDKLAFPILYNFNINNNYNFDSTNNNANHCPFCNSQNIPITNSRNITIKNGNNEIVQSYTSWTTLETELNQNFSISGTRPNSEIKQTSDNELDNIYYNEVKILNKSSISNSSIQTSKEKKFSLNLNLINNRPSLLKSKSINTRPHNTKNLNANFNKNDEDILKNIFNQNSNKKRLSSIQLFNKNKNSYYDQIRHSSNTNKKNILHSNSNVSNKSNKINNNTSKGGANFSNTIAPKRPNVRNKIIHDDNLFNEIHKNIEDSSLNLNDPQFFYTEFFTQVMNKKHQDRRLKKTQMDIKIMSDKLDNLEKLFLDIK